MGFDGFASARQKLGFWKDKTFDVASEFSWGPGLVPPGKEDAPPSQGGIYRPKSPPVELTKSPDLSVQVKPTKPQPGDPPRGYPGVRIGGGGVVTGQGSRRVTPLRRDATTPPPRRHRRSR